jgi:methyltransferase (TIGR00027 family)
MLFYRHYIQKRWLNKGDINMKDNQVSFTSLLVAYMRAYHTMHDTQKIFDDFLAYDLIPKEKRELIEQHLIEDYSDLDTKLNGSKHTTSLLDNIASSSRFMQGINGVTSRARYTEDILEKIVGQGVKQYVILGAGMDTFAFRRPDLMEYLDVFEIDHPATQEFKLNRLAELGWKHPEKLHFIPVDFTKESLVTALTRSSFYDPNVKSFFSWFGVTPYLTQEEVFATLRSIREIAPTGSTISFDYLDADKFIVEKSSPQMQKILEYLQNIGEQFRMEGFDSSKLAEDLNVLGLSLHENLSPQDIKKCYLQGRIDGCCEYICFACGVVE